MVEAIREGTIQTDLRLEQRIPGYTVLTEAALEIASREPRKLSPYYQAKIDEAETGREERIRLGDLRATQRPPLPGLTDGV